MDAQNFERLLSSVKEASRKFLIEDSSPKDIRVKIIGMKDLS